MTPRRTTLRRERLEHARCRACQCLVAHARLVHDEHGRPFHAACLLLRGVQQGWLLSHPNMRTALQAMPDLDAA